MAKEETQGDRFIKAARKLGCDEDPEAFDKALKKIAKAKPEPTKKDKESDDTSRD